jgi:tRNA threonylcarbamoyladenosine biosynthesis protein TsaE
MATDKLIAATPGECLVHSEEETARLAAYLLPLLRTSRVVSLEGPLGAGKTSFVKAVGTAVGLGNDVTSPTFTLLQSYGRGTERLHHCDWYRLDSPAEALALGLEEYYGDGMVMIEWGNKFPELLPSGTIRIGIHPEGGTRGDVRRITWERLP